MERIRANLIGIIGLFAAGAIGASDIASLLAAGPRVLPFTPTLLANALTAPYAHGASPLLLFRVYLLAFALGALAFACAYRTCIRGHARRALRARGSLATLIGLQIAIALLIDTQLLVVVAVELAYALPPRCAAAWMAAQMAAYLLLELARLAGALGLAPLDLVDAWVDIGMGLTWMALAFGIGYLAASERRGRIRVAMLHADLQSTQHLMMDALRLSERANVSRDVHDAIGHHLTALNLHLELALRQSGAAAPESLRVSRGLAQELLGEVRAVVSLDREDRFPDLRTALQILVDAIPAPKVTLQYDDTIVVRTPECAHVLLRCVQEGVTNAIRHAGASRVEVRVCAQGDSVSVRITDDGAGTAAFKEGNGLRGMRERIQALRGTLRIDRPAGGGFDLHALLPVAES